MGVIDDPKMREVFEKMTGRFHIPAEQLQKDEDGEYIDKETASYWVVFGIAWAESRDALVIELPNRFSEAYQEYFDDVEGGCFNESKYITDLHKNIEAAGVKVKS